jgi:hypothetical protein
MRYLVVTMALVLTPLSPAVAQVSIQIGLPGVSIGINQPVYPQLVPVPGYPVYYDPGAASNYFFYDGMYWVYQGDDWYASSWYNGPWTRVAPQCVPVFILRVPVRYYRHPPASFHGWGPEAPPRWGEHWGNDWERQHSGWDKWNRSKAPRPAPLPVYQKQYSGDRYPQAEQQHALRSQHYTYQPRDAHVKQVYQAPPAHAQPAPQHDKGHQEKAHQETGHQDKSAAPEQRGKPDHSRGEGQGPEHDK